MCNGQPAKRRDEVEEQNGNPAQELLPLSNDLLFDWAGGDGALPLACLSAELGLHAASASQVATTILAVAQVRGDHLAAAGTNFILDIERQQILNQRADVLGLLRQMDRG
jgi:hypothetical protein